MAEKTIPVVKSETPVVNREITRNPENYVSPPVDIYENQEGLTVLADLPGVEKKDLDVKVDEGILTIEGKTRFESPGTPIAKEFEAVNFFRQFELLDTVDQDKISAELKHGVLTVFLPKLERVKPRKIKVKIT